MKKQSQTNKYTAKQIRICSIKKKTKTTLRKTKNNIQAEEFSDKLFLTKIRKTKI